MDRLQAGDPSQIGSFQLLGRLGEDGVGRAYLGASPDGHKVAIKIVHPPHASDPEFRLWFAREAAAAREVEDFHTAVVVAADPDADLPWIATAYVPGPTLAEAVAGRGTLDEAGVRELGASLAEGLAAFHACGLIHRNLVPGNVILADDGPRMTGFGIADATALTDSSGVLRFPSALSPEQLRGQDLTPQSDVFSLGAILAYAATGHDPFEAPTTPAAIARLLNDPPRLDPLTGDLRDIIAGCLAKDPRHRPSPADVLVRLTSPESPGEAVEDDTPEPVPARGILHRIMVGRRALVAVGLFAAAIGLVVGLLHVFAVAPTQTVSTSAGACATSTTGDTLTDPNSHGVSSVAFSSSGTLATSDLNGHTYLWNTRTGAVTATLGEPDCSGVNSVAFGPDGTLATGDLNGSTYLWNTGTGAVTATLTGPDGFQVESVAFGPGDTVATGGVYGNTYLWNPASGKVTATLADPDGFPVNSVAFGPGNVLATGGANGSTYLWDTTTGAITAILPDPGGYPVNSVAFGPGNLLATGGANGSTYLWDTARGKVTATLADPDGFAVNSVTFGAGNVLATGGANGSTYLWDTASGAITATLSHPNGDTVNSVAFGPGNTLATGDLNGHTFLWRV